MPKNVKETVDLPDFVKESVPQIQILCTFQARSTRRAHLARNPCSRNRSCERNRELTESWLASSSFPSLFAFLVISVDKLFEMLVLFFVELLNLFAEVWIFRRNELILASLWICVVKQDRFKEM